MLENNITYSRANLLKHTLFALFLAAALLGLVVLPAEYGIDQTGIGKLTGLTELTANQKVPCKEEVNNKTQMSQKEQGIAPFPIGKANVHDGPPITRSFEIVLQPADEVEYKALLPAGESIFYQWTVQSGEDTYVDFHGDPTEGNFPEGYSQTYDVGEMPDSAGSFTATFTGHHGWYWLNISEKEIAIRLEVTGYYESLEEIYRGNQMIPGS